MKKLNSAAVLTLVWFTLICTSLVAAQATFGTRPGKDSAQQTAPKPSDQKPSGANEASPAPQRFSQDDFSGMYTFLREGEFVQINCEDDGTLTGFVSRYGDDPSDRGSFLDQFFDKGSYKGNELSFITKPVHSVWYEFSGTVVRGKGKTPKDEAYRVVKGKLIQYSRDQSGKVSAQSREVEMKSFPNEDEPEGAQSKD